MYFAFIMGIIMATTSFAADDVQQFVMKESERIWQRKLAKPFRVILKKEKSERNRQWPASWGVNDKEFMLGLAEDYSLTESWWASEAKLAADERRVLMMSHEISHIFMYPTPLVPWFQEMVAMKIGEEIALRYKQHIRSVFDRKIPLEKGDGLSKLTYNTISTDLAACKHLQWQAYGLSQQIPTATLVKWVENLRALKGYDPIKSYKDFDANNALIWDAYPLPEEQAKRLTTAASRRKYAQQLVFRQAS